MLVFFASEFAGLTTQPDESLAKPEQFVRLLSRVPEVSDTSRALNAVGCMRLRVRCVLPGLTCRLPRHHVAPSSFERALFVVAAAVGFLNTFVLHRLARVWTAGTSVSTSK